MLRLIRLGVLSNVMFIVMINIIVYDVNNCTLHRYYFVQVIFISHIHKYNKYRIKHGITGFFC